MGRFYAQDYHQLQDLVRYNVPPFTRSILIFATDHESDMLQQPEVNDWLAALPYQVIGGVFPGVIASSKNYDKGYLLIALDYEFKLALIDLSATAALGIDSISKAIGKKEYDEVSALLFFDAFADQKNHFVKLVYETFGISAKYLGGGAGSLSFKRKPCIITNSGLVENSGLIALFEKPLKLGVAHGWESISPPMKVTKALGNTVFEINYEPAFEVYKQIVEVHSNQLFSTQPFFELAKSYPLGMEVLDSEFIVRDPIAQVGSAMQIVDQIPEGEFVQVLYGNLDSLLKGAAIATANANLSPEEQSRVFCIDCISRVLYMGKHFNREINSIHPKLPVYGVLTIGEIANNGDTFLEIFNKTLAVSSL